MTGLHKWWIEVFNPMYLYINRICLSDPIQKLLLWHGIPIHRILLVCQCSGDCRLIIVNHMCLRRLLRQIWLWYVLSQRLDNDKTSPFAIDRLLFIIRPINLGKEWSTITVLLLVIRSSIMWWLEIWRGLLCLHHIGFIISVQNHRLPSFSIFVYNNPTSTSSSSIIWILGDK